MQYTYDNFVAPIRPTAGDLIYNDGSRELFCTGFDIALSGFTPVDGDWVMPGLNRTYHISHLGGTASVGNLMLATNHSIVYPLVLSCVISPIWSYSSVLAQQFKSDLHSTLSLQMFVDDDSWPAYYRYLLPTLDTNTLLRNDYHPLVQDPMYFTDLLGNYDDGTMGYYTGGTITFSRFTKV